MREGARTEKEQEASRSKKRVAASEKEKGRVKRVEQLLYQKIATPHHQLPQLGIFKLYCAVSSVVERSIAARRVSGSNPELRFATLASYSPLHGDDQFADTLAFAPLV